MTRFIILLIKIYQYAFSPFFGNRCRFTPTCSVYTIEALKKHGLSRGLWLTIKGLLRCRPGSKAGFDPIPK